MAKDKSRTEAYNEMNEAMIAFFALGGDQGEVHRGVEFAWMDYRQRRAADVKEQQRANKEAREKNEAEKL